MEKTNQQKLQTLKKFLSIAMLLVFFSIRIFDLINVLTKFEIYGDYIWRPILSNLLATAIYGIPLIVLTFVTKYINTFNCCYLLTAMFALNSLYLATDLINPFFYVAPLGMHTLIENNHIPFYILLAINVITAIFISSKRYVLFFYYVVRMVLISVVIITAQSAVQSFYDCDKILLGVVAYQVVYVLSNLLIFSFDEECEESCIPFALSERIEIMSENFFEFDNILYDIEKHLTENNCENKDLCLDFIKKVKNDEYTYSPDDREMLKTVFSCFYNYISNHYLSFKEQVVFYNISKFLSVDRDEEDYKREVLNFCSVIKNNTLIDPRKCAQVIEVKYEGNNPKSLSGKLSFMKSYPFVNNDGMRFESFESLLQSIKVDGFRSREIADMPGFEAHLQSRKHSMWRLKNELYYDNIRFERNGDEFKKVVLLSYANMVEQNEDLKNALASTIDSDGMLYLFYNKDCKPEQFETILNQHEFFSIFSYARQVYITQPKLNSGE